MKETNIYCAQIALIAVLGVLAYSNTFGVPFLWDDKLFFSGANPILGDFSYFAAPSGLRGWQMNPVLITFPGRLVSYFTLALNHRIHGGVVWGYHAVNLAVHVLNSILVFRLVGLMFRTPLLAGSRLQEYSGRIALFAGVLFVSHPIQTQAVTYIFQRHASLAAFFYLLSVVSYVSFRLSGGRAGAAHYAIAFVCAVAAMKTKENAFTLPLMITAVELMFFKAGRRERAFMLVPFLLTMLVIPVSLSGDGEYSFKGMTGADSRAWSEYFFTGLRATVTYLRLIIFPAGQNLDYDYPAYSSMLDPNVFLSIILLGTLFGWAVFAFIKYRRRMPEVGLLSFGVVWFFVALSVESGILPIRDVIFEHRAYLPSAGIFMTFSAGMFLLFRKFESASIRRAVAIAMVLIPVALGVAAYARNEVWQSDISLWSDVVNKSPNKSRGHNNLGIAYRDAGRNGDAIKEFERALAIEPSSGEAMSNLAFSYMNENRNNEAAEFFRKSLEVMPHNPLARYNLGVIYLANGEIELAEREFAGAIEMNPGLAQAWTFWEYTRSKMSNK